MDSAHLEFRIFISPKLYEPAIALLSELPFYAFQEGDDCLKAFAQTPGPIPSEVGEILKPLGLGEVRLEQEALADENWNSKWESNFQPVEVDDQVQIIATFHPPQTGFEHTLVIQPQMSFGTGHHETTRLMIRAMLGIDFARKTVLDMGCGTGVLGILAIKLGSGAVLGIDIDRWSMENAKSNADLNDVDRLEVIRGDAQAIPNQHFDVILANINRHVLASDAHIYVQHLAPSGKMVLSGFYVQDLPLITQTCSDLGLELEETFIENDWVSAKFVSRPKEKDL